MSTSPPDPVALERLLVEAARGGDEDAYRRLIEGRRAELHAHCYRMLGSVQDAEDALQDALLRAWRGLPRFDGRSSLRSWLYRIATNTSLDMIARRRPTRVLPMEHGPEADPGDEMGEPLVESIWLEAYPDERIGIEDGRLGPEARVEQRESVELAFVAALQHLPARQRAVLILREVLGFSAREAADALETSVASVNSALQRARQAVDQRLPERSQQATLRQLGDDGVREIVERYTDAMQRADVDAVVAMLTEEAVWSMPPLVEWYRGREAIAGFLANHAFTVRWRHLPAHANGQPAVACYAWDEASRSYVASVLDVLTIRDGRIDAVTSFATVDVFSRLGRPDTPYVVSDVLRRFGLPDSLPA